MEKFDNWIVNHTRNLPVNMEEVTILESIQRIAKGYNEVLGDNEKLWKMKTDLHGDHKGSWQGIKDVAMAEPGIAGSVIKNREDIIKTNEAMSELDKKVAKDLLDMDTKMSEDLVDMSNTMTNNINSGMVEIRKVVNDEFKKMKGTIVYMADIPPTDDYGVPLNKLIGKTQDYVIVCENNKEYNFRTPVKVLGRLILQGNDSLWRFHGSGYLFTFVESPWNIEGSRIEDIICWSGVKSEGPYSARGLFDIQGNHINIKFRNIKSYNFGVGWRMKDTSIGGVQRHTFGHSITECSVWGFINGIFAAGNAEQVLVQHCWFDDGKRTQGSQNPCIRVTDATSFWIRDNVIQNCDIGIAVRGVKNCEIQGNHFENMIDSSIYFNPAEAYENRNCNIIGNWLVGHKGCIRFLNAGSNGLKSIHTTIISNVFAFLGSVNYYISVGTNSESNTQMINNSRVDGSKAWYPSTMVTIKEWQ